MSIVDRLLPGTAAPSAPDVDVDELLDALSNARRRHALRIVADGPIKKGDLAGRVAAAERDTTVAALTSNQRKAVYVSLHQSHLDALTDAGLVAYDRDADTVRATPATGAALDVLEYAIDVTGGQA